MNLGLVCLLIKQAGKNPELYPHDPLAKGFGGALIGGGLGGLAGGLHGYFTAPEEYDPETGKAKSKLMPALTHAGVGALAGGGIGGLVGLHSGVNQQVEGMQWLQKNYPDAYNNYITKNKIPNLLKELENARKKYEPDFPGYFPEANDIPT